MIVACGVVVSLRHRATRRLILRMCRPSITPQPVLGRENPGPKNQSATIAPVPFGSNMKYDFKFEPSWSGGAKAATTGFDTENHGSYITRRAARQLKPDARTIPQEAFSAGRSPSSAGMTTTTTRTLPGASPHSQAVINSVVDDRGSFVSPTQPANKATGPHPRRRVMKRTPPFPSQPLVAVDGSVTSGTGSAPSYPREPRSNGQVSGSTNTSRGKVDTSKVDIHPPPGSSAQERPVVDFDIHWPKIGRSRLPRLSPLDSSSERKLHGHSHPLRRLMRHLSSWDLPSMGPNSLTRRLPKRGLRLSNDHLHDKLWQSRQRMIELVINLTSKSRWVYVVKKYARHLDFYMDLPRQGWPMTRREPLGGIDGVGAVPITINPLSSHSTWSRTNNGRVIMGGGSGTKRGPVLSLLDSPDSATPPDHYIVMGAGESGTTGSIWRIIANQPGNPGVIVMLRGSEETDCSPYFPSRPQDAPLEVGQGDESGDGFRALVSCESIEKTKAGDAIELRKLKLRIYHRSPGGAKRSDEHSPTKSEPDEEGIAIDGMTLNADQPQHGDQEEPKSIPSQPSYDHSSLEVDYEDRIIYHFTYNRWPMSGVPGLEDFDDLLVLMRLSRSKNSSPSAPRVVHCSAGVNTAGAFVALDHLTAMFKARVCKQLAKIPRSDSIAIATWIQGEGLIYHIVQALCEHHMWADGMFRALYQLAGKLWRGRWARLERSRRRGDNRRGTTMALDSGKAGKRRSGATQAARSRPWDLSSDEYFEYYGYHGPEPSSSCGISQL